MVPMKLLTAEWCNTCETVKFYLAKEGYSEVDIVDVDDNPVVAQSAGIKSIPSLLLGDGEVISGSQKIISYIKENYDANTNS